MAIVAAILLAALAGAGCLGTLPDDPVTREVALAPRDVTDLPLRETHRHWLFRDLPRWCSAAEVRFGGDPRDRAVLTARAARFRDPTAAMRAFERLSPEHLAILFRDRIAGGPRPIDFPPLPGDETMVSEYDLRLPAEIALHVQIVGHYAAIRAARAVLLTESIGLTPEELTAVAEAMVEAARETDRDGC